MLLRFAASAISWTHMNSGIKIKKKQLLYCLLKDIVRSLNWRSSFLISNVLGFITSAIKETSSWLLFDIGMPQYSEGQEFSADWPIIFVCRYTYLFFSTKKFTILLSCLMQGYLFLAFTRPWFSFTNRFFYFQWLCPCYLWWILKQVLFLPYLLINSFSLSYLLKNSLAVFIFSLTYRWIPRSVFFSLTCWGIC